MIGIVIPPTKDRTFETAASVRMWPYIAACFLWNTWVVGIALVAKQRWGVAAPGSFGLATACISIPFSAWLFFRIHHRQLLPIERRRLTIGFFVAFWFYDEFLKIVVMFNHQGVSARGMAVAIVATLVDFGLVWIIMYCIAQWAAKHYARQETEMPPNKLG